MKWTNSNTLGRLEGFSLTYRFEQRGYKSLNARVEDRQRRAPTHNQIANLSELDIPFPRNFFERNQPFLPTDPSWRHESTLFGLICIGVRGEGGATA